VHLSDSTTEDDLITFAETYGYVDSTKVVRDAATQRCKGFGFIYMQSIEDAWKVTRLYCQQFFTISLQHLLKIARQSSVIIQSSLCYTHVMIVYDINDYCDLFLMHCLGYTLKTAQTHNR